jgi:hypothetical protein
MVLMLWVNLTGPRGVYKYYFTLFAPFFSIFSSARIVESKEQHVPFSWSMLWLPVSMNAMILIPSRYVYLFGVLLILIGYLLVDHVGTFWYVFTAPVRFVTNRFKQHMHPIVSRASVLLSEMRGSGERIMDRPPQARYDLESIQESESDGGGSHDT